MWAVLSFSHVVVACPLFLVWLLLTFQPLMLFKVYITRFFQYNIMYNICTRSLNSSESCKTFFSSSKHADFPPKCPSYRGATCDVEWFEKCRFFEFQKYEGKRKTFVYDKRLIFTRIKNHFRSLASYESLALKQRFGATREWPINNMAANKLSTTPQSSSKSSFVSPYLFYSQTSLNAKNTKQVFGTFFEGKRNFWTAKIQEIKV